MLREAALQGNIPSGDKAGKPASPFLALSKVMLPQSFRVIGQTAGELSRRMSHKELLV
ncbi:hypothetical protein PFUM301598_17120 [Pseudomonas fluorescens]